MRGGFCAGLWVPRPRLSGHFVVYITKDRILSPLATSELGLSDVVYSILLPELADWQ